MPDLVRAPINPYVAGDPVGGGPAFVGRRELLAMQRELPETEKAGAPGAGLRPRWLERARCQTMIGQYLVHFWPPNQPQPVLLNDWQPDQQA